MVHQESELCLLLDSVFPRLLMVLFCLFTERRRNVYFLEKRWSLSSLRNSQMVARVLPDVYSGILGGCYVVAILCLAVAVVPKVVGV